VDVLQSWPFSGFILLELRESYLFPNKFLGTFLIDLQLNLNALYEALPPQGMPLNRAPPQWGQPIPQFPPNAIQGGFGYGNYATPTMVMPTVGTRGFSTGAVYGGPQFFSQTAGSNPFH
jgi:hypothetical protein